MWCSLPTRSYANKSGMVDLRMPVLPGLPGTLKQEAIDYVKLHKVLHDSDTSQR